MKPSFALLVVCLQNFVAVKTAERTFSVDYEGNEFLKDGRPFRYISGCMHYFRVPKCYWRDRLKKMRAGGLDTIETYVPWNFHWEKSGYNFGGQHDVVAFLNMVKEEGMLAIVRGFPFSDTEWDMGGLPYWLLRSEYNPPGSKIALRTSDQKFLSAVGDWLNVILPLLKPQLYNNGGPVIMVQVENEYGSYYAHDDVYMKFLYQSINLHFDGNVVLFTTDGNNANDLKHGGVGGALQTVDFGPGSDPKASFDTLRKFQPNGPVVNSEFYTGWLDHWGEPNHHRTSAKTICSTFDKMLSLNASVNFYMFVGGTNFGYWSGSNSHPFGQVTTSYDYDSPISENGDTTYKYFQIRDVISKYKALPPTPIPPNVTTIKYEDLELKNQGSLWDQLHLLCKDGPIRSSSPLSYEDLLVQGGYVLYRVNVTLDATNIGKSLLLVVEEGIRDSAQVYVNQTYIGSMDRDKGRNLTLGSLTGNNCIELLVESRGRICFGSQINDSKGISGLVKLTADGQDNIILRDWEMFPLRLESLTQSSLKRTYPGKNTPAVYANTMNIPTAADTFVSFSGGNWTSGYILVNGFNLGRYDPGEGPQRTLYLPTKAVAHEESSITVIVFETKPAAACSTQGQTCTLAFTDRPELG